MNGDIARLALRLALKSTGNYRLGAVVAKRCRVLSTGFNRQKTHPIMEKYNASGWTKFGLHAEVDSCLGLPADDLLGAEVYVGRIMKNGLPSMAKPCEICERFLRSVGVAKVYYSTQEGWRSAVYETNS